MRRRPVETDFKINITKNFIEVRLAPTRSLYTFILLTSERDVAEFGPLSPDPFIQRAWHAGRTRKYDAADVLAMAFRLATAAVRAGT
jgi:hypothetical protein